MTVSTVSQSISTFASSVASQVVTSVQWLGRTITAVSKFSIDVASRAIKQVAVFASAFWVKAKPYCAQAALLVVTPYGAFVGAVTTASLCLYHWKKGNYADNQALLKAIGFASAAVAVGIAGVAGYGILFPSVS